jgi:hypothetical protein
MSSTEIVVSSIVVAVAFILFIVLKIKKMNQIASGNMRPFHHENDNDIIAPLDGNDVMDIFDGNFGKPPEPFHHPVQDLPENKDKE